MVIKYHLIYHVSLSVPAPSQKDISTGHRHCNITRAKQSAEYFCVCVQVCKDKNNLLDLGSKKNKCWHSLSRYTFVAFLNYPWYGTTQSHSVHFHRVKKSLFGSHEVSALRSICQTAFFFLSVLLVLIALFLIIYFPPHFYLGQPSLCETNTRRQLNITWHPLNLSSVKLRV